MQGQRLTGSTARSTPNRRDLRKYARLFVKTDQDGDGFVSSDEAYSLFTRSQLPEDALQQIWTLSNVSGSGMLSFPEFVAAMHLIREARQTQQSPEAISSDLFAFLGSLSETAQELSVEGSSQSARTLQGSHAPASSAFQGTGPLSPHSPNGPSGPSGPHGPHSPHFGHAEAPAAMPGNEAHQDQAQDAFGLGDWGQGDEGKKKKGRRKEKQESPPEAQLEVPEVPWDSQVPAPGADADFGSAWTTFGDQENTESKAKKEKKEKKEKKDKKDKEREDKQTRFEPEPSTAWPTGGDWSKPSFPALDQSSRGSPQSSPSAFRTSGTGGTRQTSQPQTRMGLRFDLDFGKDADPDYIARLQEMTFFARFWLEVA